MPTPKAFSYLSFGSSAKETKEAESQQSHEVHDDSALTTPFFSVVSGNPTDEEIAALTAVLKAMESVQSSRDESSMVLWQRRLLRGQSIGDRLRPGPGSWRHARPM